MITVIFVFWGFLVCVLMGMTGIGGGALTTPFLLLIGIPPTVAVGSDLTFAAVTRGLGAFLHGKRENIDFRAAGLILAGGVPAMVGSYFLTPYLKNELGMGGLNTFVVNLLAAVLILVSVIGLSKGLLSQRKSVQNQNALQSSRYSDTTTTVLVQEKTTLNFSPRRRMMMILCGAFVGFIVEFTSVGSGTLLVFLLLMIFKSKKLVGIDLLTSFTLTLLGAFLHFQLGEIDYWLIASFLLGGIPGILLGVRLHSIVSFSSLRVVLNFAIMGSGLILISHALI